MPKTICFIRHAQALHNVDARYHLPDPHLSEEGFRQCEVLQDHLKQQTWTNDIELIVTSPFRRTLDTTLTALDWLIRRGTPVIPLALWQENSGKPCDTGTELAQIAKEYPTIDLAHVDPMYPAKSGIYAYTQEDVIERGAAALAWLQARPEAFIAIVTHSAFLRTGVAHRRFDNADYRLFELSDPGDSPDLVESEVTEGTGGMGKSPAGWMGIEAGDFDDFL